MLRVENKSIKDLVAYGIIEQVSIKANQITDDFIECTVGANNTLNVHEKGVSAVYTVEPFGGAIKLPYEYMNQDSCAFMWWDERGGLSVETGVSDTVDNLEALFDELNS